MRGRAAARLSALTRSAEQVLEAIPTVLRQRVAPPQAATQLVDENGTITASLNTAAELR